MAIYHCNVRVFGRSKGKSAVKEAAYVAGLKLVDSQGKVFDQSKKNDVYDSRFYFPDHISIASPHPGEFWSAVEGCEIRCDAQLAREVVVALPVELDAEQHQALLKNFIEDVFVSEGMVAFANIHYDNLKDCNYDPKTNNIKPKNPHCHIMLTLRKIHQVSYKLFNSPTHFEYKAMVNLWRKDFSCEDVLLVYSPNAQSWEVHRRDKQNGFTVSEIFVGSELHAFLQEVDPEHLTEGQQHTLQGLLKNNYSLSPYYFSKKERAWNDRKFLCQVRECWCDLLNEHLRKAGVDQQLSHKSHKRRGLSTLPGIHVGKAAFAMQDRGLTSDRVKKQQARQRHNELKKRKQEAKIAELRELKKVLFDGGEENASGLVARSGVNRRHRNNAKTDVNGEFSENAVVRNKDIKVATVKSFTRDMKKIEEHGTSYCSKK